MSLDNNVLNRDTIFLAGENEPLSGFFSSFKKKIKKVASKVGKSIIPKKIYKQLNNFEKKHRKDLKKLGAVAAIGAGAYFAGPTIYKYGAEKLGGKSVIGSAIKKFGKSSARKKASKFLRSRAKSAVMNKFMPQASPQVKANASVQYALERRIPDPQQRANFTRRMRSTPPEQVLQDPIVTKIGRDVASYEAGKRYPSRNPYQREASRMIAKEGAVEVEHQTNKKSSADMLKYAIPAGGAILAAIIAKS